MRALGIPYKKATLLGNPRNTRDCAHVEANTEITEAFQERINTAPVPKRKEEMNAKISTIVLFRKIFEESGETVLALDKLDILLSSLICFSKMMLRYLSGIKK